MTVSPAPPNTFDPGARPPAADDSTAAANPPRRSWWPAAVVTLLLAVGTAVAFPGNISFINDEPRLLANAFHANADRTLAVHGLQGNFRITYGPAATHIYQLILLFTHDPLSIVVARAGLSAALTAIGLLWLARSLRLNPWFATAVVLAPFLRVFHGIIWDASWAIPVGTVGLAAYAAFLRHGRPAPLAAAVFCTLLLPFIHPQDVLLALPIGLHMLWRHGGSMLRKWPAVVVPAAVVLGLNYSYVQHVRKEVRQLREQGASAVGGEYPGGTAGTRAEGILSPFLSGRILSGHKFVEGGFTGGTLGEQVIRAGKVGAYLIYPLIWGGTALAAWRLVNRRRLQHVPNDEAGTGVQDQPVGTVIAYRSVITRWLPAAPPGSVAAARDAIAGIALATAALQMVLFGLKKIPIEPQYYFGTFPTHVLLAWFAVDALRRVRLGTAAVAAYGLSVAAITLGGIWFFDVRPRVTGDPRTPRPEILPLAVQADAARLLNQYAADEVYTDVTFYQRFPQALRTLRLLIPPDPGTPRRVTLGRVVLTFGDGPDGPLTRLVVVEARTDVDVPPGAEPITVTPLPKGWLPPPPKKADPPTRPATRPDSRPAAVATH